MNNWQSQKNGHFLNLETFYVFFSSPISLSLGEITISPLQNKDHYFCLLSQRLTLC